MTLRKWTQYQYGSGQVDTGVTIIWDYDEGGYDWEGVALVARPKGEGWEYAVYSDSGCSCRYMYEDAPDQYDLSWEESLEQVKSKLFKAIDDLYDLRKEDKIEKKVQARRALIAFFEETL